MYFMYLMYGERDFTALTVTAPLIGPAVVHEREFVGNERHFCALSDPVGNPLRQAPAVGQSTGFSLIHVHVRNLNRTGKYAGEHQHHDKNPSDCGSVFGSTARRAPVP